MFLVQLFFVENLLNAFMVLFSDISLVTIPVLLALLTKWRSAWAWAWVW
jgi:hypothetical protein